MTFITVFYVYIFFIYLSICKVLCIYGFPTINILDGYYDDATNFLYNQPIIDGITLILPQDIPEEEKSYPVSNVWQSIRDRDRPQAHHRRPYRRPQSRPRSRPRVQPFNSEPHYNRFKHSFKPSSKWKPKVVNNGNKGKEYKRNKKMNEKTSFFDSLPPYSAPNQSNFHKPIIKLSEAKSKMSDSPNQAIITPKSLNAKSLNHFNEKEKMPKNYRTATANQLSHKDNHIKNDDKKNDGKQVVSDDPNHYPHQYAIEIRWKNKNNQYYDPNHGNYGGRELHSSKDFEHSKYRLFEHKEEEHWHEKDWLNEGLKKGYINGQSVPVHIIKPNLKIESNAHYNPIPVYAQPMPDGATRQQIDQHFAVPSPGFRVNDRFMKWAQREIDLSNSQTMYSSSLV